MFSFAPIEQLDGILIAPDTYEIEGFKEELMDASGNIDVQKAGLVAYCHGIYHGLGEALGFFGFSVAAPKVYARRMKALKQK